jgi:hypothetical protein
MSGNEQVFLDLLRDWKGAELSTEWVRWMLLQIQDANERGVLINPAWLRATHRIIGDNEPGMEPGG